MQWLPDHLMHGTCADCATTVELILSPSARIAEAGGPRNTMLREGGAASRPTRKIWGDKQNAWATHPQEAVT